MDIFDAADLLAIEQDDESSSSSCSDSGDVGHNSSHHETFDGAAFHDKSTSQVLANDGSPSHLKQSAQNILGDDDDESDSSDDDGFLESMLTLEKDDVKDVDDNNNHTHQDEPNPDTKGSVEPSLNTDDSERSKIHNIKASDNSVDDKQVAIELGDSIDRWITSHRAAKENPKKRQRRETPTKGIYDGVISIQRRLGFDDLSNLSTQLLRVENKKSLAGREIAEATLDQLNSSSDVAQSNQQCGIAALVPNAERANLGTMVDCLARYDHDRGVYVLEIVDVDVSDLSKSTHQNNRQDSQTDNDEQLNSSIPPPIVDPRIRAKEALKQVRRLKQRKGIKNDTKRAKVATNNTKDVK